jgi:hypothetical protein
MRNPVMFRKKNNPTLIVEAMRLIGEDNVANVANWSQSQIVEERDALSHDPLDALNVRTPDGNRRCSVGMYVVKIAGHFYVQPKGKFEQQYEPIP